MTRPIHSLNHLKISTARLILFTSSCLMFESDLHQWLAIYKFPLGVFTFSARKSGDREKLNFYQWKVKAKETSNLDNSFPTSTFHKYLQKSFCFTHREPRRLTETTPKLQMNRSTSYIWKYLPCLDSIMASPFSMTLFYLYDQAYSNFFISVLLKSDLWLSVVKYNFEL